ncbi:hypothetical protein P7C70_g8246, partial [Phenoliferia sp. Uapishka_3]
MGFRTNEPESRGLDSRREALRLACARFHPGSTNQPSDLRKQVPQKRSRPGTRPDWTVILCQYEELEQRTRQKPEMDAAFRWPFGCLKYDTETSTLLLNLPRRYTSRRLSPTFHASQLNVYEASDATLFPNRLADPVPIFPMDQFLPRSSASARIMNANDDDTPAIASEIEKPAPYFIGIDFIKDHYRDRNGLLWFILTWPKGYSLFASDAPQLDTLVR